MSSQMDIQDKEVKPRGLRFKARVLTWLFRRPLRLLAAFRIFRAEVIGRENVPRKGAVIVACNHISIADPVYLWGAMRRPAVTLAMIQLWKVRGLRWVLNQLGQIPVDRENPRGVIDMAVAVLNNGGSILIYPPGRCSSPEDPLKLKPGVAIMAIRTGTPIVPAAVYGTHKVKPLKTKLWHINRRARVCTIFGDQLIDPKEFEGENAVADLLDALRAEIVALLAKAKERVEGPAPQV